MSKRDGHEWVHVEGTDPVKCQGKNSNCPKPAKWEKVLFSCDKSSHSGGYFCNECADEEEGKL